MRTLLCILVFCATAWAQYTPIPTTPLYPTLEAIFNGKLAFQTGASAPVGACVAGKDIYTDTTAGKLYFCTTGGWQQVSLVLTGTTLPGTCRNGEMFVKSDATPGQRIYVCVASAWEQQGEGAAIAAVRIGDGSVSNTEFQRLDGVTAAIQGQLDGKEPSNPAGTESQYYRGDKSWQTLWYQRTQANGTTQTQRANLNFSPNFTLTDVAGSDRTSIELSPGIALPGSGTTVLELAEGAAPGAAVTPGKHLIYINEETGRLESHAFGRPAQNYSNLGYALRFFTAGSFSPSDDQTNYFGAFSGLAPTTNAYNRRIRIPAAGAITAVTINVLVSGTLGSTELSTMWIRLNNTTDTAVFTAINCSTLFSYYINADPLYIPVEAGDFIEWKWVAPTWATDPTGVVFEGSIYIESKHNN